MRQYRNAKAAKIRQIEGILDPAFIEIADTLCCVCAENLFSREQLG